MTPSSSADRHAHEVVGLYGDPDNSWGICAEFRFTEQVDPAAVDAALGRACREQTHLGEAPQARVVADPRWEEERRWVASAPYRVGEPLLRVRISSDGRTLLVGAHHGVVDGLGLVALAATATGLPIAARARGIGDAPAPSGFWRSSLRRLAEALFRPPPRFAGHGVTGSAGAVEDLSSRALGARRSGTGQLAHAVALVFAAQSPQRRPLLVVGASRRPPGQLAADRSTAFLRVRLPRSADLAAVRRAIEDVAPEPDFPETTVGGIGPRITHLLRGRLGATALLSNLGVLEAPGLESVTMFPAASGPRSVAVGLASTPTQTMLSLHTRRADFTRAEHDALLVALTEAFASQ